ncbi:MAG: WD40 repeat domain-containing serine/threonine-protein kinase [Planctomycetota bacterium]
MLGEVERGEDLTGRSIGPFRFVRRLGEGAMGIVYEAEQDQPRRRVAVKVLRGRSRGLRQRFEREAEFLARLEHPGIARIYDAGVLPIDGEDRPYISIELVDGIHLGEWGRTSGADLRTRVELLCRVGHAIEHAHRKGVLHRDLKPENLYVDRDGEPRILDFGIARLEEDTSGLTMQTQVGQILGTLAYMSPEQARGGQTQLDTRSDLYSLAVVGFELLAGFLPLELTGLGLPESLRRILEDAPRRLGERDPTLRGDLETIFAKALEKDPERRYGSVAAFVDDLERWLADEPVRARPASLGYQLRKFAARNRRFVVVAGLLLLALLAAMGGVVWFALEESNQRQIADAAREGSRRQLYRATVANVATAVEVGDYNAGRRLLDTLGEEFAGRFELDWLRAQLARSGILLGDPVTYIQTEVHADLGVFVRWRQLVTLEVYDKDSLARLWSMSLQDGRWLCGLTRRNRAVIVEEKGRRLSLYDGPTGRRLESVVIDLPGVSEEGRDPLRAVFCDRARKRCGLCYGTAEVQVRDLESLALVERWTPEADDEGVPVPDPEGRRVVIRRKDFRLRLHEVGRPGQDRILDTDAQQGYGWVADGRALAVRGKLRSAILDADSGEERWSTEHGGLQVLVSDDGRLAAKVLALGPPARVRILDVGTGEELAQLIHEGNISSLSASPDFDWIGSASQSTVLVWNWRESRVPRRYRGLIAVARPPEFDPDGAWLFAMDVTGASRAWPIGQRQFDSCKISNVEYGYGYCVRVDPQGRRIYSATFDGNLQVYDARTRRQIAVWDTPAKVARANTPSIQSLELNPSGGLVAATILNGLVTVFDARSGAEVTHFALGTRCMGTRFLDEERMVFALYSNKGARCVEARTGKVLWEQPGTDLIDLAVDGRGRIWGVDRLGVIWTCKADGSGTLTKVHESGLGYCYTIDVRRDGTQVVIGSSGGRHLFFDTVTGEARATDVQEFGEVFAVRYSPDGRLVASGGRMGKLRLIDSSTGDLMLDLRGHSSPNPLYAYIHDIDWFEDGSCVVTCSGDHTLRFWDRIPLLDRLDAARKAESLQARLRPEVEAVLERAGDPAAASAALRERGGWDDEERAEAGMVLLGMTGITAEKK